MLRVCDDPFEEYGTPLTRHKSVIEASDDSVVIDCQVEDWDGCLYNNLYNRRRVELRNLHSSYEKFMTELAEFYCMQFTGDFTENRGEFRPRT